MYGWMNWPAMALRWKTQKSKSNHKPCPMPPSHHLLIVDDEDAIAGALATLLAQAGYTVSLARDGYSALRALGLSDDQRAPTLPPINLVILDLLLPGIDGYDVCRRIRQQSPAYVPILMLTARDELADRVIG